MTIRVYTRECPQVGDGRTRHYFIKQGGEFVCQNCGEASNPAQRWESPDQQQVG